MASTQITAELIKDGDLTDADMATANKDGTAGTASMRTLGTGSQQACGGADERLARSYRFRQVLEFFPDANDFTWQNRGWKTTPVFDAGDATLSPSARPYARATTAGTTGSTGGIRPTNYGGNGENVRPEWFPEYVHHMGTRTLVTSIRLWHGFSSASLDAVDMPTTQHVAAFRYSTGVDGTAFWRCVTCDGASNVTTTTTTVAIATSTFYDLRIEFTAASTVLFYINDVLVATHTTNTPGTTTGLSPISRVITLTNQARQAYFGRVCVALN